MIRLRDITVGTKVLMALGLSTGIALLVMTLVVSGGSLLRQQRQAQDQLTALADVTGQNTQAALTFRDTRGATETLNSLRSNALVATAAIYDSDGQLFASLPVSGADPVFPSTLSGATAGTAITVGSLMSGRADLARPITHDGEHIGTVLLVADLRPVWNGWLTEVALLLVAATAAFGSALMLALYMRRLIAGPLTQLSRAVQDVTRHQDYSLRVAPNSRDEIGLLGIQFNDMLAQIESRDSLLALHQEELEHSAHYDALTGVPNRRLLADRLAIAIARARRSGKSMAVCYLDLDGFKAINDSFGHGGGDQMLIEITDRLKCVLRADDTLSRLGGDEFVLLLSDIPEFTESHLIFDRLLEVVSSPVQIEGQSACVSASIGITLYPGDDVDADSLLRHADQAMYRAKEAGKNRYHLFDADLDQLVQAHRSQIHRLHEALQAGEFLLYYQPKVDLLSGEVVGAEALIRWQHPERGLLAPAEFLPYVYGSDLEIPLGEWVIETALRQMEVWNSVGLKFAVSVNVSATQLLDGAFCERLRLCLERHPAVVVGDLELEILETAALADMDKAVQVITRCRQLGVRFALDDFGTGFSSLTYFRQLPVDILKIDQSFVREMMDDPDDLGIVETVVKLAHAFNRPVIAEGVETLEIGRVLIQLGCNLAQGYGISRPLPAGEFPRWMVEWRNKAAWRPLSQRPSTPQDLTLEVAQQSYRNWIAKITEHLDNPEDESLARPDGHQCKFWRWYCGSGTVRYREFPEFHAISLLHEKAHLLVLRIISQCKTGQVQQALQHRAELYETTDALLRTIDDLIVQVSSSSGRPPNATPGAAPMSDHAAPDQRSEARPGLALQGS